MKKLITILAVWVLTLAFFTGCNAATTAASPAASTSKTSTSGKKLAVYTSFYAMYDFTKKVGGDKITVTNLVPAGTEPHDWEPSTTDISNLEKADMLICNGADMEHWVDKVVGSLENKKLVTVKTSDRVTLLAGHKDENGETSQYDPHVWLSPVNAKKQMENIKNALVKADTANKEAYESNYKKYAAQFDDLDKLYKDTITKLPKKDIIVAHEAFGYMCKAYGLNQVAIEGLSADSEPNPAKMTEIIKFAKAHNVKTIFFEDLVSPKVSETIASAVGAKTAVFNPLEGLTNEEQAKGEEYVSVMKTNLQTLKGALQ